jgi:acyl-coenzyme A synthetase/AMP-(fatty) acid ligase
MAATTTGPVPACAPLSADDVAAGVIPRLHTLVTSCPQAIAAADHRRRVSYAALARQAGLVRAAVRAAPGNGPVGLLAGHDATAIGSLLGVLASGRPLVVLDPTSPAPRLRQLLSRARAGVCVTDAAHAEQAAAAAARVVVAERLVPAADTIDQLWSAPPDPAGPAVLAFTSGTTGRPKLLVNSHRMLVRDALANSLDTGCYAAGDVVAHTLPLAFHAGLMAAVAGVLVGATLRFHDVRAAGTQTLAPWLHESGATVAHLSPAAVRALVAARPDPALLAGLRSVTVTGEPLYGPDAAALLALLPGACTVHHRYGSSETGLICDHPLGPDAAAAHGVLPVGRAVPGLRVDLVDADGRPVPGEGPGIVAITGPDLGGGYWDDPQASAAAFTPNPDGTRTYRSNDVGRLGPDGRLQLLGRRDFSVRIGDYLVEPGEVDAALFELPDVREAVTVGRTDAAAGGPARLVAYVVPDGPAPDAADLRRRLAATLPEHMVPAGVVFLPALPVTDRGKVDRSALPPPEAASAA